MTQIDMQALRRQQPDHARSVKPYGPDLRQKLDV